MANKKNDILGSIIDGVEEDSIHDTDDFTELLYRRGRPSDKLSAKKSIRIPQQKKKENGLAKKKVTYYIPEKVSVELGEAKAKIKVMVPAKLKSLVSMSRIVELALSSIFNELETKGQKSSLVKNILKENQKNNS